MRYLTALPLFFFFGFLPQLPPQIVGHVVDPDFQGASAVVAVDLDMDGRIDIVGAGKYEDYFSWWRNLGSDQWQRYDIHKLNGASSIRAADIDGDGDMDLVGCSEAEDSVWWYENKLENANGGVPNFVVRHIMTLDHEPLSVDAADFDGDGDMDVAVAFMHHPIIYILPNKDGTGKKLGKNWKTDSKVIKLTVPGIGVNGMSFVRGDDFDHDGDIDVIAVTPWNWVEDLNYYWFRNEGGGNYTFFPIAGGLEYNGAFNADIADIDGDGFKDIVTSTDGGFGNTAVRWVRRRNAEGSAWAKGLTVDPLFFGSDGDQGIQAVDLDGDGDMDIVGGSFFDFPTVRVWLNRGDGKRWRTLDVEAGFRAHGVATADLDGDGQLEIIGASWGKCCYTGEVKYWRLP